MDFVSILDAALVTKKIGTTVFDTDKDVQLFTVVALDQEDTYTTPVAGGSLTIPDNTAFGHYTLQVKGTGAAPTAAVVVLENSLNNSEFKPIITFSIAAGDVDGDMKFSPAGASYPGKFFRSRLVSVTLGSATNVKAYILGMP